MSELLEKFKMVQQEVHLPLYEARHPISVTAQELLRSPNPEDRETTPVIDDEFLQRDLPTLHSDLGANFSEPIAQAGIVTWLANAPASHAAHILGWHNDRVNQLQQRLTADKFVLKETSNAYMQHLIKAGIYPYTAIAALYHSLNTTPIKAVGTLASHGILGYFDGRQVGLADVYDDGRQIGKRLKGTYFHEQGHAMGGLPYLLNEVVVTHNTNVAMDIDAGYDGQPTIIDTTKRRQTNQHGYYPTARQAIGILAEYACIDASMLTEAHFGGKHSTAYREVDSKLTTTHQELTGVRGGFKRLLIDYAYASSYSQREVVLRKAIRQMYSASVGRPALSHEVAAHSLQTR